MDRSLNVPTADGRRIVDDAIQAVDDIQAERLAGLRHLISQDSFTDKSLDEALCRIARIGRSTWHVEVCRLLCERVRSSPWLLSIYALDETDNYKNGPLHVSLRFGRVSIARLMLEDYSSIFNVNQVKIHPSPHPHGATPLHYAVCIRNVANARANRRKMCRVLLNHGAKPNNDKK